MDTLQVENPEEFFFIVSTVDKMDMVDTLQVEHPGYFVIMVMNSEL